MRSSAHRHRLTRTIAAPPRSTRRNGPLRAAPFADDDTDGLDHAPSRHDRRRTPPPRVVPEHVAPASASVGRPTDAPARPRPARPARSVPRTARRRRWPRRLGITVALAGAITGLGALVTPWQLGSPLLVTSTQAHNLSALHKAQGFQASFAATMATLHPGQTSLSELQGIDTALTSLGTNVTADNAPPLVMPADTAVVAEVTAARKVVGYLEDADQSGIVPTAEYDPAVQALTSAEDTAVTILERTATEIAP